MPVSQQLLLEWVIGPVIVLIVLILSYLAGIVAVKPFVKRLVRKRDESDHLAKPLSRAALYLTVFAGLAVGLVVAGYRDVFAVLGTLVAAGTIAAGFALRDTLSAFVAGILIFFGRPFRIGDIIEWNDHIGRVIDIRIRTTRVETFDNEVLSVPNNEITETTVKNLSANTTRRHSVTFGIGYDDDLEDAKQILRDIVADTDGILDGPEPMIVIDELGGSAIDIVVRYWMNEPSDRGPAAVRDELYQRGIDAFEDAGIDIPYPTRTIAGDALQIRDERDDPDGPSEE